jgi:hypothetical protein
VASVETLKAELAEIDRLDRVYWMTIVPEQSQKLEYFHRQKRRKALIRELVNGSNEEDDI